MSFTLKDLKHLEVFAELDDREVVKPELPKIIEEAEKTSSSFDEQILSLCSSLRSSGFEKQAAELEDRFILFKQAEPDLYKTHNEKGEDLIQAAHPEGDTPIEGGELGDVETILSSHKKIVNLVSKEPTGKSASKKKAIDLNSYVERCKKIVAQVDVNQQIKNSNSVQELFDKGIIALKKVFQKVLAVEDLSEIISISGTRGTFDPSPIGSAMPINTSENHLKAMSSNLDQLIRLKDKDGLVRLITQVGYFENQFEELLDDTKAIEPKNKETYRKEARSAWMYFLLAREKIKEEYNTQNTQKPIAENNIDINSEVKKLNIWKEKLQSKQMDDANKNKIKFWINNQVAELMSAKSKEEVAKIIEENKKFEAKGLL